MQTRAEEPVRVKMAELRVACDKEISIQRQKMDLAVNSFKESLQLVRSRAQETCSNEDKLGKLKSLLRKLEDDLVKAIAVKTRKEAKQMALMESISDTRMKVEQLNRILQDQTSRKDEFSAILFQQSEALAASEEKYKQDTGHREEIQQALTWYNQVLCFRIDGGHGIKFTFTNINRHCPTEEYSFTIRHANDVYTLLDCYPKMNGEEELIHELNKTNGLFKFVRVMREKFQEAVGSGSNPRLMNLDQHSAFVSLSGPVSSVSTDSRSESPAPLSKANRNLENSLASALSLHQSPRFKVKK